jgi:diguanylate cyclase (GGDEF)-like protein
LVYAVTVCGLASALLLTSVGGTRFGWYADDIGDFVVAGVAAVSCGWRARRSAGRLRAAWTLLAVACASWALGTGWWCWYQLGLNQNPFPSMADIGYLGFPVAASAALLLYPTNDGSTARGRRALDTALTIGAMALISWETVLTAVANTGLTTSLGDVLSLVYPLTDLAVLILAVLTLARVRAGRLTLGLIAAGVAALSLSDSLFSYLTATSSYDGGAVDIGWFVAFVLLTLAPLLSDRRSQAARAPSSEATVPGPSLLAYTPLVAAATVTTVRTLDHHRPTGGQLLLVTVLVVILLARQYLTVRENARLASSLGRQEIELRHQAFHDNLTGLPNRALFLDRLDHALALHARDLRAVSVMFFDLDDFKVINDTLGHTVGDELLKRVADRLVGSVRSGDTIARLGGDEFAVLLEDQGDISQVAEKIADALRYPFALASRPRSVTASIGVVVLESSDGVTTADVLVTRADTAMYAAKRAGKGQIVFYREGMALREVTEEGTARALAKAIGESRIDLVFQPVVNLVTGRPFGLEALARWNRHGEQIPPSVFIPIAEGLDLLEPLTKLMMTSACARLRSWSDALNDPTLQVSVNVPSELLAAPGFRSMTLDTINRHRLQPGQLIIELTESSVVRDITAARRAIAELRSVGVPVWLDDFGVGYSSLSQLHELDFDLIKLDRSFVHSVDTSPRQAAFLSGLLQLSATIGTGVLAEGIETPAQLARLQTLGCTLGQGYLFARPLVPDAVLDYLVRARSTDASIIPPHSWSHA